MSIKKSVVSFSIFILSFIWAHRVIEWVTAPIFVLITVYFQRVSGWLTH